jgi:hypothetical protein
VWIGISGSRSRAAPTIADESIPPESAIPSGTSLRRFLRTESTNSPRTVSPASANDPVKVVATAGHQ